MNASRLRGQRVLRIPRDRRRTHRQEYWAASAATYHSAQAAAAGSPGGGHAEHCLHRRASTGRRPRAELHLHPSACGRGRSGALLGGRLACSLVEASTGSPAAPPQRWHDAPASTGRRRSPPPRPAPFDRPRLMGILNVTPDSFSDGGAHADAARGRARAAAGRGGCRHRRCRWGIDPAGGRAGAGRGGAAAGAAGRARRWPARASPSRSTPARPRSWRQRSRPAPRSSTMSAASPTTRAASEVAAARAPSWC